MLLKRIVGVKDLNWTGLDPANGNGGILEPKYNPALVW